MCNKKINTQKIHFLYVIGILLIIIIILFTYKFKDSKELVGYISFALTITSLFLALISIIYAFYSNISLSNTLVQLNSASKKVEEISGILNSTTNELRTQIENIPYRLQKIELKIDDTQSMIKEKKLKDGTYNNIDSSNIHSFDDFCKYSSPIGLLALYAVYLSNKTNKSFTLKDLKDTVPILSVDYTNGFLVACSSIGLFNRKDFSENWTIPNILDDLNNKIESNLIDKINSMSNEDKFFMNKQKIEIENLFQN